MFDYKSVSYTHLDVYKRQGVRSGTHTCLVGEEASGDTLGDGELDGRAHCAAGDGSRCERAYEDLIEGQRDISPVADDHDERPYNIESCHQRHHGLGYLGDPLHTAGEDEDSQYCHDQTLSLIHI